MTRTLLFFLFFFSLAFSTSAQNPYARGGKKQQSVKGKIIGEIVDSLSQQPVEFASIALYKSGQDKIVGGTISDESGKFKLVDVSTGKYDLQISFLGYQEKWLKDVELSLKHPDSHLEPTQLSMDSELLDEIEVVEEASLIENKIDRIVYNAEKDISTDGDGADVLRKVPLLSVDLEGNVSLRGSQNVQILINGKPSGMFSASVADALKMISSDQIKSVEVITSPSAKYDAEGTAGIINIITKKKSAQGVNGSINLSAGTRHNRAVGNLNIARGRMGFNLSGSTVYSWPAEGETHYLREDYIGEQTRIFKRDGTSESSRVGFNGSAGFYYDLNAFNSINSSFQLRGFGFDNNGSLTSSFSDPNLNILEEYVRFNQGDNGRSGFEWTTDYTKKFSTEGQELAFAYQVNGNNSDTDILYDQLSDDPFLVERETNFNKGRNTENTIQVDYTHPFSKKFKLEVGGKSVFRTITSDYRNEQYNFETKAYDIDLNRTDLFEYDQDIMAGYASANIQLTDGLGLLAGARYEHTNIGGDFRDTENPFSNSYGNLIPSIILSQKIKKFNTIKLAYNQRLQRPSLRYINPFINNDDNRNISFGNPELIPELSHQVEVGYTAFVKGTVINTSVYYRHTNDVIESILNVDQTGISVTSYSNLGTRNTLGMNVYGSVTIKKNLTLRGGFDFNTFEVTGSQNGQILNNTGVNYSARVSGSLNLPKDFKVEAFGFLNSPRQTVQGKLPSFSMFNLGMRKEIWKKKGSIGITMTEPWKELKAFRSELTGNDFYQTSESLRPFRSFGINFRYNFGKLDFRAQNRSSKIRNNDMKQGSDPETQGN